MDVVNMKAAITLQNGLDGLPVMLGETVFTTSRVHSGKCMCGTVESMRFDRDGSVTLRVETADGRNIYPYAHDVSHSPIVTAQSMLGQLVEEVGCVEPSDTADVIDEWLGINAEALADAISNYHVPTDGEENVH